MSEQVEKQNISSETTQHERKEEILEDSIPYPIGTKDKLEFLRNQSKEVTTEEKKPGEGLPRRNSRFARLRPYEFPNVRTLYDSMVDSVKKYSNKKCLGTRNPSQPGRPYVWLTYKEVFEKSLDIGSGFIQLGIKPKDKIGLYAINRLEWILTEQASNFFSMPTVALYDTFGSNIILYIINHAELSLIVCSMDKTKKLLDIVDQCPNLKFIVQMEELTEEQKKINLANCKLVSLIDIENEGKINRKEPVVPKPEDLAVIMYTSGTTGLPKGVMHTHAGMMASLVGIKHAVPPLAEDDVYISYLPLAHIMERMSTLNLLSSGASIGFYSGDARNLLDDIDVLKPSLLSGVPRVFERIYTKALSSVESSGAFKKLFFNMAYNKKKKEISSGTTVFEEAEKSTSIYNKIVFSKMKSKVGGRLRGILCGGAPLPQQIHEFLKVCFGCPVVIGYGLTETCAAAAVSDLDDPHYSVCGPPVICCEIKLVDVVDMNYLSSSDPPCGEIWVRGPNVSIGYYKDEQKTKEDFDSEGWFHTGDIGMWNKDGTLSLIDRKKNFFKLSQGEYIAAEKLELIYARSKYINQIFVYGDSYTPFLIAVVVLEPSFISDWAENRKVAFDMIALSQSKELKNAILDDFSHLLRENDLQGFEAIKDIIISNTEFTPDNELCTPTMKIKRPQLKAHFKDQITATYKANGIDLPQQHN